LLVRAALASPAVLSIAREVTAEPLALALHRQWKEPAEAGEVAAQLPVALVRLAALALLRVVVVVAEAEAV
jgi:hypothetical protein